MDAGFEPVTNSPDNALKILHIWVTSHFPPDTFSELSQMSEGELIYQNMFWVTSAMKIFSF